MDDSTKDVGDHSSLGMVQTYEIADITPERFWRDLESEFTSKRVFDVRSAHLSDGRSGRYIIKVWDPRSIVCLVFVEQLRASRIVVALSSGDADWEDLVVNGKGNYYAEGFEWDRLPDVQSEEAARVRAWIEKLCAESSLPLIRRAELAVVRGWPAAQKMGVRQEDYCIRNDIASDTLRLWNKKYKDKGFDTGW